MKATLNTAAPSQIETECLVVAVVDAAENNHNGGKSEKHDPQIQTDDRAVKDAAADLIASGEVTGKMMEITLLHKPQGLKAKRLLLVGGGKAKSFSSSEVRKMAGAAVRTLKAKDLTSFAFIAPDNVEDSVKSMVEGAIVGNFDPDYYKSDRKEQMIDEFVIVASRSGHPKSRQTAMEQGRIIGESQNFARDLVNEPGNRMTPTILADARQSHVRRDRPGVRNLWSRQNQRAEDGRVLERLARLRRRTAADHHALRAAPGARKSACSAWSARESLSIPAASPSSRPTAWRR